MISSQPPSNQSLDTTSYSTYHSCKIITMVVSTIASIRKKSQCFRGHRIKSMQVKQTQSDALLANQIIMDSFSTLHLCDRDVIILLGQHMVEMQLSETPS